MGSEALDQSRKAPNPARWHYEKPPVPPVEEIARREAAPYPVYGIYTWFGEYEKLREDIKKVGWSTLRIGGPTTDANMRMLFEDGAAYDTADWKHVPLDFHAAYLCRYYAFSLRLGVSCVTPMFVTDTDGFPGGFFDRLDEWKWRPAADAVRTMIDVMPHPKLIGSQAGRDPGACA